MSSVQMLPCIIHSSVEVRSVLTQPLDELCANAALRHSLLSHTRMLHSGKLTRRLSQPLNELCADAALHHSRLSHIRLIALQSVEMLFATEYFA